ncbi:MAG: ABC transporter permease subunit [Actinobacteria bacterium]|nr:ABC transporter permease subunit [Actinomycetota bacterium]
MFSIIWRTIKDRKISLISYSLGAAAFLEMYVALFPLFAGKQKEFEKLLNLYPEQLFQALGMDKASFNLARIESFIATEHFSLIWPIMAIIMMIAFGGAQIAGEIEKGTIETILAQPISRLKVFLSKYLAGLANLFVFVVVSVFAIAPFSAIHNVDYKIENFIKMAILGFLFGLAIFSFSMLASSVFSEKGKSNLVVGGTIILMYVINTISTFKESLKNLRYLSFFYYYDFSAAMNKNTIDGLAIWVFLGVSITATILGAVWFMRRDVGV